MKPLKDRSTQSLIERIEELEDAVIEVGDLIINIAEIKEEIEIIKSIMKNRGDLK